MPNLHRSGALRFRPSTRAASARHGRPALAVLAILSTASCSTFGSGPAAPVAGTYRGVVQIEAEELSTTLTITQRGRRLQADAVVQGGLEARGDGEISNTSVFLQLDYDQGCDGRLVLSGRAVDGGDRLVGSVRAVDCTGEVTGSFVLRRR